MKKIVKLTEEDLTRIVRRVLNEQSKPTPTTQVKKLKVFRGNTFYSNFDVWDTKVMIDGVNFNYKHAGTVKQGKGVFKCDKKEVGLTYKKPMYAFGFKFSPEGEKYFNQFCDQYVQNTTSSDQSTNNYV